MPGVRNGTGACAPALRPRCARRWPSPRRCSVPWLAAAAASRTSRNRRQQVDRGPLWWPLLLAALAVVVAPAGAVGAAAVSEDLPQQPYTGAGAVPMIVPSAGAGSWL